MGKSLNTKQRVIFLLKNGIGFGHFRRALVLASELEKKGLEIIFLSQAKSTRIFDEYKFKVINVPLLHSLKSNNAALAFNSVINFIIEHLNPSLVIEDTYSDDYYLNIPALATTPRILILRRVSGDAIEEFFYSGKFGQYDMIYVMESKELCIDKLKSPLVKSVLDNSDLFDFCGDIFFQPEESMKQRMNHKYKVDQFDKTVVVNGGAGGWHLGENVCELIFDSVIEFAKNIKNYNQKVQFIIVTGPYSEHLISKYDEVELVNYQITMVGYEGNLSALLNIADVCVLRPGYNTTMEALQGEGQLILLPGISYMEDQKEWCDYLHNEFMVDFIPIEDIKKLQKVLLKSLIAPKPKREKVRNNACEVAEKIIRRMKLRVIGNNNFLLAFNLIDYKEKNSIKQYVQRYPRLARVSFVQKDQSVSGLNLQDTGAEPVVVVNSLQQSIHSITEFMGRKIIFYNDSDLSFLRKQQYEAIYDLESLGIISIEVTEIPFTTSERTLHILQNVIANRRKYAPDFVIKISQDSDQNEILKFIDSIHLLLEESNLRIMSINESFNEVSNQAVGRYRWNYDGLEIRNLS
ncbi:glycosyltransferase [Paenibacillus lautus]|uniref:glycosyltransferase n=1 Tax=Paenibacillus lautus TaxID=1401 RepID=UPI003D2D5559